MSTKPIHHATVAGCLKKAGFEQIANTSYYGTGFKVSQFGDRSTVEVEVTLNRTSNTHRLHLLAKFAEALLADGRFSVTCPLVREFHGDGRTYRYLKVYYKSPDVTDIDPKVLKAVADWEVYGAKRQTLLRLNGEAVAKLAVAEEEVARRKQELADLDANAPTKPEGF